MTRAQATHTASYSIHHCQYKPGAGTDLETTEPVVATGSVALLVRLKSGGAARDSIARSPCVYLSVGRGSHPRTISEKAGELVWLLPFGGFCFWSFLSGRRRLLEAACHYLNSGL